MERLKAIVMFGVAVISFIADGLINLLRKQLQTKKCDRCGEELHRGMCVFIGNESVCLKCWGKGGD